MLALKLFRYRLGGRIVRRIWAVGALVALLLAIGLAVGCSESNEDDARTPSSAETVVNSAAQTDENGQTVTAPADEPATGDETQTAPAGDEAQGDVAAGEAFFANTCSGCHMDNGKAAGGVGPQLAGVGLTVDQIKDTVTNGKGAMPPGLASGADLDNVAAYVASIQ